VAWKGREGDIPCGETESASLYGSIPLVDKDQVPIRSDVKPSRLHSKRARKTTQTSVLTGQSVKIISGKHFGKCGEVAASHNGFWVVKLANGPAVHVRRECVHFGWLQPCQPSSTFPEEPLWLTKANSVVDCEHDGVQLV
jgi:hypothetical protein